MVPKTLWTQPAKIVIVRHVFQQSPFAMMFRNLLAPLILFSLIVLLTGCKSGGTQPSNPFAQNPQTVPPPATFSSQESYLGQIPGSFVPQTPASTFQPSGSVLPTQPAAPPPAAMPFSDATNNSVGEGATLFAAANRETNADTGWVPIEVVATSQTAFQAMDAKVNSGSSIGGIQTNALESLVVGTSHVVTTIVDETTTLTEPQTLLYSGGYGQ